MGGKEVTITHTRSDRGGVRTEILNTTPALPHRRVPLWRVKEGLTAWMYISPAIILFLVFGAYPLVYGFLLSFAQWNGLSPNWTWVGLDNYRDLLGGRPFVVEQLVNATWVTLMLVVAVPLLTVAISFPIAIMLNGIRRFRGFLRTIYFLPYVTAGVAVIYAWRYIFDVDGALNSLLRAIGLGLLTVDDGLLGTSSTAIVGVIVMLVWSAVPLGILLYLTGLQTLDGSVLEAAAVDGAGPWRTFWSIVSPMLAPTTALLVVLTLRDALQNFVTPLLMTNGGPFGSTTPLSWVAYNFAFGSSPNLGYASALGWILFIVGIFLALINLRVGKKRD